ncbi:MAG: FHA domain-containing protein [Blastocatellia bacterium]|nr:FHA domain-containing protein [Blastocatellia bacterium]
MNDPKQTLSEIEQFLSESVRQNEILTIEDVDATSITEQIAEDLKRKRFLWLGYKVYVPNKFVCYLPSSNPEKLEEFEVIFNSASFVKLLNKYILDSGYKLFDDLKVEVRSKPTSSFSKVIVDFSWPGTEEEVEDVTVKLDLQHGTILEVYDPKPEIPRLARLSVISGEVYRDNYLITKLVTNIGRLRNVFDKNNTDLIRRNDFIFARNMEPSSPNSSVSRQHACIVFREGKFYLIDQGSANGTSIERAGVDPIEVSADNNQGVALEQYDIIRFGTALVRFEDNAKIGLQIDRDVVQPLREFEPRNELQTTLKLTRKQIEMEMEKLLESE